MKTIYKKKKVPFRFKHETLIGVVAKSMEVFMAIIGLIFILSVCCIDSNTWIPMIVCVASALLMVVCAWLHDFWVLNFMDGEN